MLSVIIPLYNKSVTIRRSIDSLLSQNYHEFEIVIIDDGSSDDSALYVKQYKDSRIKYFYKENGGVSSARNFGINKALGEWIIFLDADDEFISTAFENFVKILRKYSGIKVFIGQQEDRYKTPKLKSTKTTSPFFQMWLNRFYPRPGAIMVHKEVLRQIRGFDERQSFFEDLEFGLRTLTYGNVVFFNQQVVKYNQEETGLSRSLHPIVKEMAYYIPEQIATASFWHKALLYENLEMEILWWQQHGNEEHVKFYQDMQRKYFSRIYSLLHWVRQKMIRKGIL